MLEKDVTAIKSELAVIHSTYWMREDARILGDRVSHIEERLWHIDLRLEKVEAELVQLKADVAQLKLDVSRLQTDVETLATNLTALTNRFDSELPHLATKADLYKLEARMKAWGIGLALSVITINTGVNFAMYNSLKAQLVAHAPQGKQPLAFDAAAARPAPYFLPGW